MALWGGMGVGSPVRINPYNTSLMGSSDEWHYGAAILRALAEKLIPGVPYSTRIAILQQTDAEIEESSKNDEIDKLADSLQENGSISTSGEGGKTALEQVIASDTMRAEVERKISG